MLFNVVHIRCDDMPMLGGEWKVVGVGSFTVDHLPDHHGAFHGHCSRTGDSLPKVVNRCLLVEG